MAALGNVMKLLQYAPMLFEVVKSVLPALPSREPAQHDVMRDEMASFQRHIVERFTELENENTRLRTRLRDMEGLVSTLQLWVWVGGGALFLLFLITLIVVLTKH